MDYARVINKIILRVLWDVYHKLVVVLDIHKQVVWPVYIHLKYFYVIYQNILLYK